MTDLRHTAWLGLGGNIGDVTVAMSTALQLLDSEPEIELVRISRIYKTPPWGVVDQPWFLNCCASVHTSLSPEQLLEACQAVERDGKRERIKRWGPRTIDVDILVFEGVEQNEQRLTLPHPRMLERAFVLVPLVDIAPHLIVSGKAVSAWLADCESCEIQPAGQPANWWQKSSIR